MLGFLTAVAVDSGIDEIVDESAWIRAMLEAEAGLARAQARMGVVPESAAHTISVAANSCQLDATEIAAKTRATANPVVAVIAGLRNAVRELDSTAVDFVHRGSTSQDILDSAAMLLVKSALEFVVVKLSRISDQLHEVAVHHASTLQAGRTLGLHAVPTTFGAKVTAWDLGICNARSAAVELTQNVLPVSLGGAAGTLAGYLEVARLANHRLALDPLVYVNNLRQAFADELGLAAGPDVPWHAVRGILSDVASVLARVSGATGKIATDVLTLSRTEISEVREVNVRYSGASSAMPHKTNPVLSTMIRSSAAQVPALLSILHSCALSEDERSPGMWHSEWMPLSLSLALVGGSASTCLELVECLEPQPGAMARNVESTAESMSTERLALHLSEALGAELAAKVIREVLEASTTQGRSILEAALDNKKVLDVVSVLQLRDLLDHQQYTGVASYLARSHRH